MLNKILIFTFCLVGLLFAKVEVEKIIKTDTLITVKIDTIKKVVKDTVVIQKTYKDTSILMKVDTVKKVEKKNGKKK